MSRHLQPQYIAVAITKALRFIRTQFTILTRYLSNSFTHKQEFYYFWGVKAIGGSKMLKGLVRIHTAALY